MQPLQRRRRRFAEFLVRARHAAEMGEAKIECDVDDARIGWCSHQPRVEMAEANVPQHIGDRRAKMPLEAKLKCADADAGGGRKPLQIQWLGGVGV